MSTKPPVSTSPADPSKIIEVRPSRKFGGSWVAFESPGVEPTYAGSNGRELAIEYARQRFGGSSGEVRVFTESDDGIAETFTIDGRDLYPHAV